jgi:hypothetical protein
VAPFSIKFSDAEVNVSEKQAKGPSLSALAALITLAVALWMEVDLATALFRSVLVYIGLSMLIMVYRTVLGRFVAAAQQKAEQELLEKIQKEAEEEARAQEEEKPKQTQATAKNGTSQKKSEPQANAKSADGDWTGKETEKEGKEVEDVPV